MRSRRGQLLAQVLVLLGVALLAAVLLPAPAAAEHPNHAQGFRPEHVFDFSGIENVNLFNRNLTLTIPIGPAYPVGPDFSYQLVLTYTGNVWDWEAERQDDQDYLQTLPRYRSNAGLGRELSLGHFLSPADPLSANVGPTYESPDQSLHEFFAGPLHLGEQTIPGADFTRDSTYLRALPADATVELPSGLKRFFGPDGLSRIEDPFVNALGEHPNYLEISYGNRGPDGVPMLWTLTDSYDRHHEIRFERQPVTDGKPGPEQSPLQQYRLVVKSVTLEAFDGSDATYVFEYNTPFFPRPCNEPVLCPGMKVCGDNSNVSYPVLTSVTLPDGSAYTMPLGAYHVDDTSSCGDRLLNGHLTRLGLPTGGAFEWTWTNVGFPEQSRKLGPVRFYGGRNSPFRQAAGISSRRHLDSSGDVVGEWTYGSGLNGVEECPACELQTLVTDPYDHVTTHYFSVDACQVTVSTPCTTQAGWTASEYGLPFTRRVDDGHGRFLSREVHNAHGDLLRSVYVRYEDSGAGTNPRLASEKTVYEDDASREATTDLDDFDGLGHYRTKTETGTFPFASTRVTVTDYNPGRSVSDIPNAGEPWVLGTYDLQTVTEGTETVTREACFDPNTGFLEQTRAWQGTARGEHDVVTTRRDGSTQGDRTDGFVRHERTYGGDGQTLGLGGLCNLSLPANAAYGQEHTYSCGVLKTSQWTGTSFFSTDRTINCRTGLVQASRDSSGLATTYMYDDLGRLTRATPPAGLAQTNYIYAPYEKGKNPAKVAIVRKLGSTKLAGEQYTFDGLGRVVDEQRDLPGGVTAERTTIWTGRDQVASRETWHLKGAAAQGTTLYSGYDPFGRLGTITLPDGFQVELGYAGERSRTTTVSVGESLGAAGAVTTTQETTEEIYDRFGRLREVREPNDGAGVPKTRYSYDVQGNLATVRQNVGIASTQARDFTYDGRGFLTRESHPELGTAVIYSQYDPLGNPGRIERGGWDLRYDYDPAGRLVSIDEKVTTEHLCPVTSSFRTWKEWTYATDNHQAGTYSNGKLVSMKRHNWVVYPPSRKNGDPAQYSCIDPWVEESYTYDGVGGGISDVKTVIGTGSEAAGDRPTFDYGIQSSPLGDVAARIYPTCSHLGCDLVTSSRTVTQSFDNGFLTAIPGFAPSIQYHPNSMVSKVEHGNGVTWLQEGDPTGMARPSRIVTTGASENLNTGAYAYDGAGNVVRTGADRYLYDQVSRVSEASLGAYPVSCTGSRTVTGTEAGQQTYESCGTIDVGPYTIERSGDVTLRAEGLVAFHDGFSVQSGGTLAVEGGAAVNLSPPSPVQRTQSYQYDRFGNLTRMTTDGVGETFTTDPVTNRLTSSLIQYDASGNLARYPISISTFWGYDYDPFNMLRHITRPDGRGWVFVYGPGDERAWSVDWTADFDDSATWNETFTLRDLDGSPLRQYKYEKGGQPTKHWSLFRDYVWRGNTLLATVRDPGTTSETAIYLHPDHLGTPRLLTGPGGATVPNETHVYFPFGQEATIPTNSEVLQFTGHERDDLDKGGETLDLDYMHARYFSPHLGRFMSFDPIGGNEANPQSWNRYSYVLGNPLKYVDPYGLAEIDSCSNSGSDEERAGSCEGTIDIIGEDPGGDYDPLTGYSGYVDLVSGSASMLQLSGGLPVSSGAERFNSMARLPQSMQGMTFQEALNFAVDSGAGVDCASDPNCIMLAEVSTALENPLYQSIRGSQEVGLAIVLGGAEASEVVVSESRAAGRAGVRRLFGRGGLLNSNRYLRIGFGRKGGLRVFRIGEQWVERVTGDPHFDLWTGGPL